MANIYEKLQKCRVDLQKAGLKKTGHNKFSDYDYFELGDFLPKANELFQESKLCGLVSFGAEQAVLTVVDTEKPEDRLEFTCTNAEAVLKGCHAIQIVGAIQTYQRRYLYVTALEITEHDALDATTGQKEPDKDNQPSQNKNKPKNDSGTSKDKLESDGVEIKCDDCQNAITATKTKTVETLIIGSQKYYKKNLCSKCAGIRYRKDHPEA